MAAARPGPQVVEGARVLFYFCCGRYPPATKRFVGQVGRVAALGLDRGGLKCLVQFAEGQAWVRPRYLELLSVPLRPPAAPATDPDV